MGTHFKIDHIVIMVDDLATAMADYKALGFTVLEGGSHAANPTHNALVVFEDGVYLEIIALRPGDHSPRSGRLQKWVQAGPGLVDMALLPPDIEADIATARSRGLDIEEAKPGGRLRPDGQEIKWKTANLRGAGLPFFCADVTPRSLRVPEGEVRHQPNRVTGVAGVIIAVTELDQSVQQYEALLGLEPQPGTGAAALAAKTASFTLEGVTLTLAEPDGQASPLQAYLASGGERPYMLKLGTRGGGQAGVLDLAQTHGADIELIKA